MPLPADVITMMTTALTQVTPTAPTFNSGTNTITIPSVTGVRYTINGEDVAAGAVVITTDTLVTAYPTAGYKFPAVVDNDWFFDYTAP